MRQVPARWAAWLVRASAFPFGARRRGPDDACVRGCADLLLVPSESRERLTTGIYLGEGRPGHPVADLERAFRLSIATAAVRRRLTDARCADRNEAVQCGIISAAEREQLAEADQAAAAAIAVDAFPPEALAGVRSAAAGEHAETVARPAANLARSA